MRMSCNGCRILRKGCSEECNLRPCIQWMVNPESQSNATLFLAKFYGRAGLINLINAGPENLRPEIFKSLLYEACGRIMNPVNGAVGMMWSGNWQQCHEAVDSVLAGSPILQLPDLNDDPTLEEGHQIIMPIKSTNIRHFSKDIVHRVKTTRKRFKRSGGASSSASVHGKGKEKAINDIIEIHELDNDDDDPPKFSITGWEFHNQYVINSDDQLSQALTPLSHDSVSVETVEPSLVAAANYDIQGAAPEIGLELTLGIN